MKSPKHLKDFSFNSEDDLALKTKKVGSLESNIDSVKEESAEQQLEIHTFMKRYDEYVDEISARLNIIEKKMWMAMGIITAVTIVLQSETLAGFFFNNHQSNQKSVIMRVIQ